jgi:hypothetical protein
LLVGAGALADDPGCELYLINRQKSAPDIVWVTELWRSQADLDASIAKIGGTADVAAVMALVDDWEMIELDLAARGNYEAKAPSGSRTSIPVMVVSQSQGLRSAALTCVKIVSHVTASASTCDPAFTGIPWISAVCSLILLTRR